MANTVTVKNNYLVALTDDIILVDTSDNPVVITMPATHAMGTRFTVKDKMGTSAQNSITIVSIDGDLFDGNMSFSITSPRQAITLHSTGSDWAIF